MLGGSCFPAEKSIIAQFNDGNVTMATTTTTSTPLVLVPALATFAWVLLFVILFGVNATGVYATAASLPLPFCSSRKMTRPKS